MNHVYECICYFIRKALNPFGTADQTPVHSPCYKEPTPGASSIQSWFLPSYSVKGSKRCYVLRLFF